MPSTTYAKQFSRTRACFNTIATAWSALGFGYVVCQPATDEALDAAMTAYRTGSDFSFMTKESSAAVRPVAFGGQRRRGNEVRLHSHLGECFAGDWAINKNRHMLFGQRFVWVTDCHTARFILLYDGNNPAVLRLLMRLMCWDIDIIHRMTFISPMPITGHSSARTSVSTFSSNPTLILTAAFASSAQPQHHSQ